MESYTMFIKMQTQFPKNVSTPKVNDRCNSVSIQHNPEDVSSRI